MFENSITQLKKLEKEKKITFQLFKGYLWHFRNSVKRAFWSYNSDKISLNFPPHLFFCFCASLVQLFALFKHKVQRGHRVIIPRNIFRFFDSWPALVAHHSIYTLNFSNANPQIISYPLSPQSQFFWFMMFMNFDLPST